MSCLVTTLFYDSDNLKRAIDALIAKGIPLRDLSLMFSRSTAGKYSAPDEEGADMDGPLAGLAANLIATSGSAAILATGPLMTALAGRGTVPSVGGLGAGLRSLGIEEQEAALCEHSIRNRDALLRGVSTSKERPDGIKAYFRWFDIAGTRNSLALAKVQHLCDRCGLSRHDPDAVHCKHCGNYVHIPTEGGSG